MSRYDEARIMYSDFGIDTEKCLERLSDIEISVHCWQADDVIGFDGADSLSGGIQTTGNYPGRARTKEELFEDLRRALKLCPGKKRLNVHASYAILGEDRGKVDRDAYSYKHFEPWVALAKECGCTGVDFNPTFFAHPLVKDGLTLSSPDSEIRAFWVRHGKASVKIAEEIGRAMGSKCLLNIWIPDGYKDIPADRLGPRTRLKSSLDEIIAGYNSEWVNIAVESKVFGIGVESYTVGNSEFYQNYAAKNGIMCLIDTGHYHPTEEVYDKISSMLLFHDKVALHVSRPVRWDSDHVVTLNGDLFELAKEVVRDTNESRVLIALDYFDASINRLFAYVSGVRAMQKALLLALLMPHSLMKKMQDEGQFTKVFYLNERMKMMPVSDVWAEYLKRQGLKEDYITDIERFENEVIKERK